MTDGVCVPEPGNEVENNFSGLRWMEHAVPARVGTRAFLDSPTALLDRGIFVSGIRVGGHGKEKGEG